MTIDTTKMRARLEARLDSLRERLHEINESLRQPEDDDLEEQAAEIDGDDVLERLSRAGNDEIRQVTAALRRIDAGTYGKCMACGRPITERRLEAIPETETCLECAQRFYRR